MEDTKSQQAQARLTTNLSISILKDSTKVNMSKQKAKIRLRGHHLFCVNVMNVEGDPVHNPRWCANLREYQQRLNDPSQVITVVALCGDTCRYCPHLNEGDNKCELFDRKPDTNQIDLEILEALQLSVGDEITSGELKKLIKKKIGDILPPICQKYCDFESLCHCSEELRNL